MDSSLPLLSLSLPSFLQAFLAHSLPPSLTYSLHCSPHMFYWSGSHRLPSTRCPPPNPPRSTPRTHSSSWLDPPHSHILNWKEKNHWFGIWNMLSSIQTGNSGLLVLQQNSNPFDMDLTTMSEIKNKKFDWNFILWIHYFHIVWDNIMQFSAATCFYPNPSQNGGEEGGWEEWGKVREVGDRWRKENWILTHKWHKEFSAAACFYPSLLQKPASFQSHGSGIQTWNPGIRNVHLNKTIQKMNFQFSYFHSIFWQKKWWSVISIGGQLDTDSCTVDLEIHRALWFSDLFGNATVKLDLESTIECQ